MFLLLLLAWELVLYLSQFLRYLIFVYNDNGNVKSSVTSPRLKMFHLFFFIKLLNTES